MSDSQVCEWGVVLFLLLTQKIWLVLYKKTSNTNSCFLQRREAAVISRSFYCNLGVQQTSGYMSQKLAIVWLMNTTNWNLKLYVVPTACSQKCRKTHKLRTYTRKSNEKSEQNRPMEKDCQEFKLQNSFIGHSAEVDVRWRERTWSWGHTPAC